MDDPEYIVLVALDTPSRETGMYISGGVMAAPTVGAVMLDILPYLGVQQNWSEEDAAGKTVVMEDLTGRHLKDAQKYLKQQSLTVKVVGSGQIVTGQLPAAGQSVPGGSEILLYCGENPEQRTVTVPDFTGMTRQQASDTAGSLGLYILVSGNSGISPKITVTRQNIAPGESVNIGTTIQLEFADLSVSD
jgi:stage V sporulation protein D (sporulation-specific penicillin-binding protein)